MKTTFYLILYDWPHRQATFIFYSQYSSPSRQYFSPFWLLSIIEQKNKNICWLPIQLKKTLCRRVNNQWTICWIYVNSCNSRFMPQIREGITFIKFFYSQTCIRRPLLGPPKSPCLGRHFSEHFSTTGKQ